ncbi:nuclear pore membrane glycoprotein 210-like, partial [Trifolium medium]|nr:nuclear pore membrane glycoprotein 210-like [Trifolium medium]
TSARLRSIAPYSGRKETAVYGHEIVSGHLLEPQLQNMADEIFLTVAEAMSLEPPSPVFVLVGAVVPYTLKVIRGNFPQ